MHAGQADSVSVDVIPSLTKLAEAVHFMRKDFFQLITPTVRFAPILEIHLVEYQAI